MLPGIGSVIAKQLVSYCGSVPDIFTTTNSKLDKIPGIGPKTVSLIKNNDLLQAADEEIEKCLRNNVRILFYTDKDYPYKLKQTIDGPLVIYTKGDGEINPNRTIAIVGTRQATDYGKSVTEQLVSDLKPYGVAIISGLAYGIDITAHKAAVANDIPTHAILGSGVDIIYPAIHRDTAQRIQVKGALISEFPLGTKPEAYHFPARNRIIAGMSDATVVIEAAERGGALITAEIANSYNREVFALPGNLDHRFSIGCNKLIQQQKAIIFTNVNDLVQELNWDIKEDGLVKNRDQSLESFSTEERLIIDLLTSEKKGLEIDKLAWKSHLTVNQLASVLLSLEFNGIIKALPGKKYQLKSRF